MRAVVPSTVDLSLIPSNMTSLVSNIEVVGTLGSEGFGRYDNGVIMVSKLGIGDKGLMSVLAHELAHKYCHIHAVQRDNRFLREYALCFIDITYFAVKRRHSKRWNRHRGILEMFACSFSRYVTGDNSLMSRTLLKYFHDWFPRGVI